MDLDRLTIREEKRLPRRIAGTAWLSAYQPLALEHLPLNR